MSRELLRETPIIEDIEIVGLTENEDDEHGVRLLRIKGTGSRGDVFNKNKRKYPTEVLRNAVEKAQPLVKKGKFLGQLDHPNFFSNGGDLERAAIKFTKLWMENTMMKFEANIIPGGPGERLANLIKAKVGVGMSTRGMGTVVPDENDKSKERGIVQDDYELAGIDAVLNESNQYAKVAHFEHEEGGKDVELTLDTLKKDHPELVSALKDEFAEELEKDFEDRVKKAVEEKTPEIEKSVKDSDEVKSRASAINTIIEAVKPFVPGQQEYEDAEKQKEIDSLTSKVESLEKERDEAKEKMEAMETEKQAEEAKKTVEAHIEAKVEGQRFAEQIRDRLKDCKSVEEVDSKFESEVNFINTLVDSSDVPKGKGKVDHDDEDDQTGSAFKLDEQKQRDRALAGLDNKKEGGK